MKSLNENMTIKSKRQIFKTLLTVFFVFVITILIIDWYKKKKTISRFNDIEYPIYQCLPKNSTESSVLCLSYCDTVVQFVKKNPIRIKYNIDCEVYSNKQNSLRKGEIKINFIEQVQIIEAEYRRLESEANLRMFIALMISQILLGVFSKFIDRKFKDEKDK